MKIVCDCGNEAVLTGERTSFEREDVPRGKEYTPVVEFEKFNIDSQFEWCYIICKKCNKKIVIKT